MQRLKRFETEVRKPWRTKDKQIQTHLYKTLTTTRPGKSGKSRLLPFFHIFLSFFPPQFFLHFHEAKILNQIDQVRTDQNLVKPGESDSEKPLSFVGLERRVKGSMEVVV